MRQSTQTLLAGAQCSRYADEILAVALEHEAKRGPCYQAKSTGHIRYTLDMTSVNKIVRLYPTAAEAAQGFQLA